MSFFSFPNCSTTHLVCLPLGMGLAAAPHDGVNADVSVKSCGREHRRVPGTPLDVEAPLGAGGQLVQNLWKHHQEGPRCVREVRAYLR